MDVSRKTDYALRMLAELVEHPNDVVSVSAVAEKCGVPYSFARSIQHELVQAGIVTSTRGAHGGMSLAVDPAQVTLLQIVEAIQGPIRVSVCDVEAGGLECPNSSACEFNRIWCGARKLLWEYFSGIILLDAVEGRAQTDYRLVSSVNDKQLFEQDVQKVDE